jgi:hypothetical protein
LKSRKLLFVLQSMVARRLIPNGRILSVDSAEENHMPNGDRGPSPQERLPDPSAILAELTLKPRSGVSPGAEIAMAAPGIGRRYRILRTLEVDEYDRPVPAAQIMALAAPQAAPANNNFTGKARKAAKLSIAVAEMESFADVSDLIGTLAAHDTMKDDPDISTDSDNDRVAKERRNVRVTAFLYAASRENDNDFHLIVGRDPGKPAKYMTVEISGLPGGDSPHFQKLNEARDAYFEFFGDGLPGTSYDFYDPPIPVEIEGSLFFDMSHATGSRPGPQTLRPKMPVVWEIHPVTRIAFEP